MFPSGLMVLLNALIVALVTEGLKVVGSWFGKDLSGYVTVVSAVVVAIIVFDFNTIVAALPPDVQNTISAFLQFLMVILGANGLWRTATRFGAAVSKQTAK